MLQIDLWLKIYGTKISDDFWLINTNQRIVVLLKFWQGPWIPVDSGKKLKIVKEFSGELIGPVRSIAEEICRMSNDYVSIIDLWKSKACSYQEKDLVDKVYEDIITNIDHFYCYDDHNICRF